MQWQLVPWWMVTVGIVLALGRLALIWNRRVKNAAMNSIVLHMVAANLWPQVILVCGAAKRYFYPSLLHETLVFAQEHLRGERDVVRVYERLTQAFTSGIPAHVQHLFRGVWLEYVAFLMLTVPVLTLPFRALRPPLWGAFLGVVFLGLVLVGSTKRLGRSIAMDAGAAFLALARPLAIALCNDSETRPSKPT